MARVPLALTQAQLDQVMQMALAIPRDLRTLFDGGAKASLASGRRRGLQGRRCRAERGALECAA